MLKNRRWIRHSTTLAGVRVRVGVCVCVCSLDLIYFVEVEICPRNFAGSGASQGSSLGPAHHTLGHARVRVRVRVRPCRCLCVVPRSILCIFRCSKNVEHTSLDPVKHSHVRVRVRVRVLCPVRVAGSGGHSLSQMSCPCPCWRARLLRLFRRTIDVEESSLDRTEHSLCLMSCACWCFACATPRFIFGERLILRKRRWIGRSTAVAVAVAGSVSLWMFARSTLHAFRSPKDAEQASLGPAKPQPLVDTWTDVMCLPAEKPAKMLRPFESTCGLT